jgi:hypothetical protein
MFETEFPTLLASGAKLQALLGNSASPVARRADGSTGIFPGLWPEAAPLPGLEWHVVSDRSLDSMEGVNRTSPKRVQINVYATAYLTCKQVAAAVCALIGGYQGALSQGGYLSSVIRNGVSDVFEEKPDIFRAILDFSLTYTDAGN